MKTHFATNPMTKFNLWANEAEKDPNRNLKVALEIIRMLTSYAFQFCDAEDVANGIERIASESVIHAKVGDHDG